MVDVMFAQAAEAGGLTAILSALGGAAGGGSVVAVVLIRWMFDFLKIKDEAHNKALVDATRATAADAKQAREDGTKLVAALLAVTEKQVTAAEKQAAATAALSTRVDRLEEALGEVCRVGREPCGEGGA